MENNYEIGKSYTLGIWTVKPDKDKDFISEWTAFADWTNEKFAGPGTAYLLQDQTNSLRFISFGPWENPNVINKWRETDEFKSFVAKVSEYLDDFQPNTLKVIATSN